MSNPFAGNDPFGFDKVFGDIFKNNKSPSPNYKKDWQIIIRCPFCAQKIGLHGKVITDNELVDCPKCKKVVEILIRIKEKS